MLRHLLPVLDHFELGINSARTSLVDGKIIAGFQLVYDQLSTTLSEEGLSRVEARGEAPFDPQTQECVSYIPSEEHPANTIVAETRRGYRLGGRILRAAQVVVSSGPPAPSGETGARAKTHPESAVEVADKPTAGEPKDTGPPKTACHRSQTPGMAPDRQTAKQTQEEQQA